MSDENNSPKTQVRSEAHAVSRRTLLHGAAGGVALCAGALTARRAEAKMTTTAAGYQATPKDGKACATCTLFEAPSSCKLVDGTISATGYCRFYVKKS